MQNLPVRDLMTRDLITLDKDETLDLADEIMKLARIRHLPVTENGHLVGLLSRDDLLSAVPDAPIGGLVVGQEIVVAHPETSIRDIANRMVAKDLRHVPIISSKDQGKLLGIVTLNDIARQRFAEESDL